MHRRVFVLAATLTCLLAAAPTPAASWRTLRQIGTAVDPLAPALAMVSLGAWGLLSWLSLVCGTVLLAQAPGAAGAVGRRLSRSLAPRAIRRTVELTLGLTVAVSAVTALPASASTSPSPAPSAATSPAPAAATSPAPAAAAAVPAAPGSPVPGAGVARASPTHGGAFDLDWPVTAPTPSSSPVPPQPAISPKPAVSPAPTTVAPAPSTAQTPADTAPPASALQPPPAESSPGSAALRPGSTVVVRPGDTLWHLSAAALRASGHAQPTNRRIADAWPSFWQANRAVVGADPDLIVPGTRLTVPELPGPSG